MIATVIIILNILVEKLMENWSELKINVDLIIPLNKQDKAKINEEILIFWCHDKYWSRIGVNIAPISPPIP
jgi:hypothetical protein